MVSFETFDSPNVNLILNVGSKKRRSKKKCVGRLEESSRRVCLTGIKTKT